MRTKLEYKEREHAQIKHDLLERYLETALSIIGMSGSRSITYVDCFAGPWGSQDPSLSGTSISISLKKIDEVRKKLAENGRVEIRFQAIYVEKNPKSFTELERYLKESTPPGIETKALLGDYFDCQGEILERCGRSFGFFFVDPMGWTPVGTARLSQLLKRPHSEFLINFMYDFLNRAVLQPDHQDNVEALLGPLDGEREVIERLDSKAREEHLVKLYRERLKQEMGADGRYRPRAFHASILNRTKERTHYHLVYLTRHAKGVVKFVEASQKTDLL